ncbi:MAG: hypothetical protein KGD64_06330 [Candidatus Heimdallarchaeota archaeon]|nr:hypothetical protein [Candidatus Heimdallarchaeota archaeon]
MTAKENPSNISNTIVHCAVLVSDTMVRIADLVTLTLLYHPGMEERLEMVETLYENIVNFIDDITTTIYTPEDRYELSINQYDPIFSNLKNVSKMMVDLLSLLSQSHIEMQLQVLEYLYNLNRSILEAITEFGYLVHANNADIQVYDRKRITDIEIGGHKIYRLLIKEIGEASRDWKQGIYQNLIAEKMSSIIYFLCESCKKIYTAKLANVGISQK